MEQILGVLAGSALRVVFTPQLAPYSRGILYTIYMDTAGKSPESLRKLYEQAYGDEPFVKLLKPGEPARLSYVRHNNACVIGLHQVTGSRITVVTAAIDNLVKGASGQAVQNFNLLFGLQETTGLSSVAGRITHEK